MPRRPRRPPASATRGGAGIHRLELRLQHRGDQQGHPSAQQGPESGEHPNQDATSSKSQYY